MAQRRAMKNCPCGAALTDKGAVEKKAPGLQERVMRCAKGHTLVRTVFRPLGSKTKPTKGKTYRFLTMLEPTPSGGARERGERGDRGERGGERGEGRGKSSAASAG